MATAESLVGTCHEMCPPTEFLARKRQNRLNIFEMPSTSHKNLPVKEYSRSAAGKHINLSELRPAEVLLSTMDYLVNEIVDRTDQPWTMIYYFVFDRIRAIRQDMVMQRIVDETAVEILEKAVHFYIFAHYKLCETPLDLYDPYINDSHLQECLKRLLFLYDNNTFSQNRAEFESYYLLHNLGSPEAMERFLRLPHDIKCFDILKMSWKLSLMKILGNFVAVFRTAGNLPFLAQCLIQKHSPTLRRNAVTVMNTAYSSPACMLPLTVLSEILSFGDVSTAKEFIASFGIEVTDNYIKFSKKSFMAPDKLSLQKCNFVNDTLPGSIREILQGSNLCSEQNSTHKKSDSTSQKESCYVQVGIVANETRINPSIMGRGRGRGVKNTTDSYQNRQRGRGRGRGRNTPRN